MTAVVSGYRTLKGCLPPREDPTEFRLFWRPITEGKIIFWAQAYVKDFKMWVPCDSTVRVITGGSRVQLHQFDRGTDNVHQIIYFPQLLSESSDSGLQLFVELRDHRSFQYFTFDQLSNFTDETTAENVEQGQNGK